VIFGVFLGGALSAQEQLKIADVHKIMQQIFQQHVDKREMTNALIKESFKIYIDQFDPTRVYLLEEEVRPYLQMSDEDVGKVLAQYKQDSFAAYIALNEVIQKAIERSRQYRKELETQTPQLFKESKAHELEHHEDWRDADLRRLYAKNLPELKNRIKQDILAMIQLERKRYGEQIMKNEAKTVDIYEKSLRHVENQYLYVDEAGKPLPAEEKENLFVMHVLKSLASSMDAHTKFLNQDEAYEMKVRLQKGFQGIGILLQEGTDGSVIISGTVPDSSAAKSGLINPGDRLVEINGQPILKEPFEKVMDMLRQATTPDVKLTLKRYVDENGEKVVKVFYVTLKRETIALSEGRVETNYETFGNGIIGEITLHSFYQGENGVSSESDVRDAIKKLQKQGNLRGLILDLRDNTGGFLGQAVKVAGLFITSGVVVISKYFKGEEQFYRDVDNATLYDGPLVVLTSKETASAAEIVAQALQDYGVAIVVGDERTYGKGTIQSQTVTGTGSTFFKVTVGKYYTVSGKTPQLQGVKADVVVPSPNELEPIGEEFLADTLEADEIAPAFSDQLTDVDPTLRPWYVKYYTPKAQKKVLIWREMLPNLKKNSEYRIAHNKNYQMVLNQMKGIKVEKEDADDEAHSNPNANAGDEDMQMAEAVNVVKDMIFIHSKMRVDDSSAVATPNLKVSAK
jgi:carboxyl-terminal processing protease